MCVSMWHITYRDWREWRFFRAALGTVFSWLFWSILKVKWQNDDFNSTHKHFFSLHPESKKHVSTDSFHANCVTELSEGLLCVLLLLFMLIHAGYSYFLWREHWFSSFLTSQCLQMEKNTNNSGLSVNSFINCYQADEETFNTSWVRKVNDDHFLFMSPWFIKSEV